jgi:hypothetical protein
MKVLMGPSPFCPKPKKFLFPKMLKNGLRKLYHQGAKRENNVINVCNALNVRNTHSMRQIGTTLRSSSISQPISSSNFIFTPQRPSTMTHRTLTTTTTTTRSPQRNIGDRRYMGLLDMVTGKLQDR